MRPGARGARGALRSLALLLAVPLCAGALVPAAAFAQVGHEPDNSPYQDITAHQGFTLFVGRFAGNAGLAGTGARPGLALGTRLQIRLGAPVDLAVTLGEVWTSRLRINSAGDSAKLAGNLNVRLFLADLAIVLNLTGDKSWHRLAPYAAIGLGVAAPTTKVVDPGGFELGTDFAVVPTIGTRWHLSRSLTLQLEARDYYYRYLYPLSYSLPFAGPPPRAWLISPNSPDRQWTSNVMLWLGVTYAFAF